MDAVIAKPRTPAAAWASFALGLASVGLCLLFLTGVPAVVVGLRALRAINASDGRLRGAWLAVAGMALGALGTVVTIAGVVAIVFAQLQSTSYRAECSNHLRQIGLALNTYADTRERFPAATRTPAALPTGQRLSWMADVLPLLAEATPANAVYQKVYAGLDREKAWDAEPNATLAKSRLRVFVCPAEPNVPPGTTHYIGISGVGPKAIDLVREAPLAGMFGNDRGVQRAEITAGISNTVMVLETRSRTGPWLAGGFPTVRDLEPGIERYAGVGRPFGGLHPGVVNTLYVDGSARPLRDDTPGELLRLLVTIHRQQK